MKKFSPYNRIPGGQNSTLTSFSCTLFPSRSSLIHSLSCQLFFQGPLFPSSWISIYHPNQPFMTSYLFFLLKSSSFLCFHCSQFTPHNLLKMLQNLQQAYTFFFSHSLVCAGEATEHSNGLLKAVGSPEEGGYWHEIQHLKTLEHDMPFVQERGVLIAQYRMRLKSEYCI